jgi:hypothetical protein
MKKPCNRLKIAKNKIDVDSEGMFTYIFEWYNNEKLMIQEPYKIQSDNYGLPIENYNINEMIEHKQYCCLEIDSNTLKIEEI